MLRHLLCYLRNFLKMNKRIFFLVLALLAFWVMPKETVMAENSISSIDINGKVNEDGSLSVINEIDYDFLYAFKDGPTPIINFKQKVFRGQKLKNVIVAVDDLGDKPLKFEQDNSSKKGGTYQLTKNGNYYQFKIYRYKRDYENWNYPRVTYKYTITNAVKTYKDASDLNFKAVEIRGENWADDAKVTIELGQNVKFLDAYSNTNEHDDMYEPPLKANNKTGLVRFKKADDVVESVRLRLIFPNSVVNQNQNLSSKTIRSEAYYEEEGLNSAVAGRPRRKSFFRKIYDLFNVFGFLFIVMIIAGIALVVRILAFIF